ncbi:MAG: DUF3800 domain-containing protein [Planctomycetes bacterium]|nr:DUF3800 domain-containing protein [Planctomycetota bacterium]
MNLVYLDESGNTGLNFKDKQQPIFLLAAIIIPSTKWFQMEEVFNNIIDEYWSSAEENIEIHATDLVKRKKSFKNIAFDKTLEIRDKLLQILIDYKIPMIYIDINKKRYEKFCEDNYGPGIKIDPYIMALPFVCMKVDQMLKEKGDSELGMFIFDEQKDVFADAELSIKTLRLDPNSVLKTSNIIEKGFFVDSKKSFALQLADIAAFYTRKSVEFQEGIRVSEYNKQTFEKIEKIKINAKTQPFGDILDWVKMNHAG